MSIITVSFVQDLHIRDPNDPEDPEDDSIPPPRFKRPKFTRAEAEINGTYVFGHMSLQAGDDLLQWACNEAYRYRDVRYRSMRSLSKAIRSKYAPGNVLSTNFHEPLDGHQYLWMHRRRLLDTLTSMLSDQKFVGVQYTSFKIIRNDVGFRVYGSFQGGQWYEFAHSVAQTLGNGNDPVSVLPVLASCDVTVGRKSLPLYPYIIAAGCVADDIRSEPGSWFLLAMLPHYLNAPAELAGRSDTGPAGIRRRRVELHHMAMSLITEEFRALSLQVRPMRWADQKSRDTLIMLAATIADQPQHDLNCAETSQSCKQCSCPKDQLHSPPPNVPARRGKDVEAMVRNAALKGIVPNSAMKYPILFTEQIDPASGVVRWIPTNRCTVTMYENVRKLVGGIHLVPNAQWNIPYFDYLVQAMKDSMHGQEHGNCMKMLDGTVIVICQLQSALRLAQPRQNALIKRLFKRLHQFCIAPQTQWVTMLRMGNQKLLVALKKSWANYKQRSKGNLSSEHSQPICDANDVIKAMLAMPFVLDGLAEKELQAFNSKQQDPRHRIKDPFPGVIKTYNEFLHWYMLYRARFLTEAEIRRMDEKGHALLHSLVKTFPHGVTLKSGRFRSAFCTEKPHSIVHAGSNFRSMGRCKNYNTVAPETRHKDTKKDAHKTNNQASVGMSILRCNLDAEADRRLSWLHDKTGVLVHNRSNVH